MLMELKKILRSPKTIGIVLCVILLLDVLVHCQSKNPAPTLPTPPVVVQKPKRLNMTEYITQKGNTIAYNAVNLVARVEGFLEQITFTDGTFIPKGQPLFVIEPKPYLEKLKEAKATVAAQKAGYAYAKSEYARQQKMYKENATSLNNVEVWLAKTQESEADIAKAEANAVNAEINYSYTHIAAPFDGRIGRHLIDIGNLVGNGTATNLATIEQIDPIYVYFNLNELDLIRLRKAARKQGYDAKKIKQVRVDIKMQDTDNFPFSGHLDFINTGLNASTGTMEFRALVPNPKHILVPGLFVQVRIAVTQPTPQLTIPDLAILYDQIGPYVLLMDNRQMVVQKYVELGTLADGQRAIVKGIRAEDNVIVDGLQNASPGNRVAPEPEKKTP